MGNGTVTPWNVLADAVSRKVQSTRDKRQAEEDAIFQAKLKTITAGIAARAQAGEPVSEDEINQQYGELLKGIPKDSQLPIVALGKALGKTLTAAAARRKNKGQGQAPQPKPQQTAPQNAQPAQSPTAGATNAGPPVPKSLFPTAAERGRLAGEETVAQDKVLSDYRTATVNAMRQGFTSAGKEMPKELDEYLSVWAATGQTPPKTTFDVKMHPVTVENPDGSGGLIPGMEDPQGNVWANGKVVPNAKVMPKWKPNKSIMRDGQGRFFSVNKDPLTNQPIPGTENYNDLPPSSYLDKIRTREQAIFDDSGNMSIVTLSTTAHTNVPQNVGDGGKSTPAVPPPMRKLPKAQSPTSASGKGKGTSANVSVPSSIRPTGYTKDTGQLSPVGQRVLMTTEPVLDQAKKLEKIFDDNPELKDNDQPGYLLMPYIEYRLGYASDGALESEIAGLSLGSVIEAASVLQGTSRSISALRLALVHTPNAKVDSPKNIYRKLHNDIIPRLDDIMTAANKYGRKRSTASNSASASTDTTVPPSMSKPKSIDQQADEILNAPN